MSRPTPNAFADLLASAVHEPGVISRAYSAFHGYSVSNRRLAMAQCVEREIQPGPINTFPGWRALGRYVRRGEKALTLCMPITAKRRGAAANDTDHGPEADDDEPTFSRFIYRPKWFVLAQTEGEDLAEVESPTWDKDHALAALDIQEIPFDGLDGNTMGYARERSIAINPVNPLRHKTVFHETAHILLGHTSEGQQADSETTTRSLRECEAESVALLCCAALGLPGVPEARGYIQSWWGQAHEIPEPSARRVLRVADQILKAGTDAGVRS